MKKNLLIMFAIMAGCFTSQAQVLLSSENFPDAKFRKVLSERLNVPEGSVITEESIAHTCFLDLSGCAIEDLRGIGFFNELVVLDCSKNQLETLDLSSNTKLQNMDCSNNLLTDLKLTGCRELKGLSCCFNQLATLDLSDCEALAGLVCSFNQLTSIDLGACHQLVGLWCENNSLTSLDLSACLALKNLACQENALETLDVRGCPALRILYCQDNQLKRIDVSACTDLIEFWCYNNPIEDLNTDGCESLEDFRDNEWGFTDETGTATGVESNRISTSTMVDEYYTLEGVCVGADVAKKGLYIVRTKDGKGKKVLF